MKNLVIVDKHNDFTTGSLGKAHASAIIPKVVEKVDHCGRKFMSRCDNAESIV